MYNVILGYSSIESCLSHEIFHYLFYLASDNIISSILATNDVLLLDVLKFKGSALRKNLSGPCHSEISVWCFRECFLDHKVILKFHVVELCDVIGVSGSESLDCYEISDWCF